MTREPWLLPAPRELSSSGESFALDPADVRTRRGPGLPAQGYALTIGPEGIRLAYADDLGLRYGRAALAQIAQQSGDALPGLAIRDWPDFPVRGYLLDISRDRVPTRATLARIVELLGTLRINYLELYTEHTFAYRDHEAVWRQASPITPDDVRWLDALCREHGVELGANQNAFGHLGRWLSHDAYRHLAETPDGWETRFGARMPPGCLAPGDESFAFVHGLLRELLPCFSSRRVDIGCDETFELGRGRSRDAVRRLGRGRVYLDFVLRLIRALHEEKREVLFWGDILRSHAELVGELPREDTIALAWHYEAPMASGALPAALLERFAEFGVSEAFLRGFEPQVAPFAEQQFPYWVCPGTSSWNTLLGRWANARGNLLDAAETGIHRGARGYLITDWGDNGHLQPPSVSFPPLAYGASVCWCVERNRDLELAPLLDAFVFEDGERRLGAALEELGGVYADSGLVAANASPLFTSLVGGGILPGWGEATADGVERALERIADATFAVDHSAPACADAEVVRRELVQAARLARHGAWRIARNAGFAAPSDLELRRDLEEAIEEQRACWLLRSRPGGLGDSIARLEKTLSSY